MTAAFTSDMGSERNIKSQARSKLLASSGPATFASKVGEAVANFTQVFIKFGVFDDDAGVTEPDIEGALISAVDHSRLYMEAGGLSDNQAYLSDDLWFECPLPPKESGEKSQTTKNAAI